MAKIKFVKEFWVFLDAASIKKLNLNNKKRLKFLKLSNFFIADLNFDPVAGHFAVAHHSSVSDLNLFRRLKPMEHHLVLLSPPGNNFELLRRTQVSFSANMPWPLHGISA